MQKLVFKIDFIIQHIIHSFLNDKIGQFFEYRSTDFVYVTMVIVYSERRIFILVFYFVCYSIIFYFHSLDAEKNNTSIILRSAYSCCVFVKLADIV